MKILTVKSSVGMFTCIDGYDHSLRTFIHFVCICLLCSLLKMMFSQYSGPQYRSSQVIVDFVYLNVQRSVGIDCVGHKNVDFILS